MNRTYRMIDKSPNHAVRIAKKLGITPDELEALCMAADRTWQHIAYDILDANGGKDIPRSQVIEVVMDADAIASNNHNLPANVKAVLGNWEKSAAIKEALKAFVFLHSRYGM